MTGALNDDQQKALKEIMSARKPGERYLLTGYAGSGKTTLMQQVARECQVLRLSVAMTAPTHKAVSVLARKAQEAGLSRVDCRTIFSLLSLRPKPHSDRQIFVRDKRAEPVMHEVVIIDECSMVGEELLVHIKRHLPLSFVLLVGDPAQLPPVGEVASKTFETAGRSHLDTIVRQAAGNPVLDAAHTIRESQGGALDMSWCRSAKAPPKGVFLPGTNANVWLQKAFTSPEFEADPDRFRYLAWTNDRVAEVNRQVRRWRYGDSIPTPFMPGERALLRGPVIAGGVTLFSTNEEADVLEIASDTYEFPLSDCGSTDGWTARVSSWRVMLRKSDRQEIAVHMPASDQDFNRVIAKITDDATECGERWADLHAFKASMARMQSIYALTVHTSQGSTFTNAFVDVGDIRRRAKTNVLETQQLFYVAATRPTDALVLVGA